jgi:hypothetical protein
LLSRRISPRQTFKSGGSGQAFSFDLPAWFPMLVEVRATFDLKPSFRDFRFIFFDYAGKKNDAAKTIDQWERGLPELRLKAPLNAI